MGERKRLSAERRKEAQKEIAFAKLTNVPTSPRKMRLVADMIRGKEVFRALGILKFSNKEAAARLEKLVMSAVANWEAKNDRKAQSGEPQYAVYAPAQVSLHLRVSRREGIERHRNEHSEGHRESPGRRQSQPRP